MPEFHSYQFALELKFYLEDYILEKFQLESKY
jgi:hypothetical protein